VIGIAVTDGDKSANVEAHESEATQPSHPALVAKPRTSEARPEGVSTEKVKVKELSTPVQVVNAFPTPVSSPTHDASAQKSGFFGSGGRKLFKRAKA